MVNRRHFEEPLAKTQRHTIEAVVDRLKTGNIDRSRLTDSVETALKQGNGVLTALIETDDETTENKYVKEVYDGNTLELMGYANVPTRDDGFAAIGKQFAIEVAENHVYCIGDNRADSYDSRKMGALPLEDLVGVVVAKGMGVFWSITIPVAIVLLGVGLLIYFPFKKKEKQ